MASMLFTALAASAFVVARPALAASFRLVSTGSNGQTVGEWFGSGAYPACGTQGDLSLAPTTAHVNAANGMKRITPGALGGLT